MRTNEREVRERYSKVVRRMWRDEKFMALSAAGPNAQTLWLRLLTGPENTSIPGLFSASAGALAEDLGWERSDVIERFQELFRQGLAKADWRARLVWIPRAAIVDPPANPNVVAGWLPNWRELPECELKDEAYQAFTSILARRGDAFLKPFEERFPKPHRNGSRNQEQEQEQEQEQNPQRERARTRTREGLAADPVASAHADSAAVTGQETGDRDVPATPAAPPASQGHPEATGAVDLNQPAPPWAQGRWDANEMNLGTYPGLDIKAEWISYIASVAEKRGDGHPTRIDEPGWSKWITRAWTFARERSERRRATEGRPTVHRASPVPDELVQAYGDAVRSVVECWSFPAGKEPELAAALRDHCVGPAKGHEAKWLAKYVPQFVRHAQENRPEMWGAFGPQGFLRFLNAGLLVRDRPKVRSGPPKPGEIGYDGLPVLSPEEIEQAARDAGPLLEAVFAKGRKLEEEAEARRKERDARLGPPLDLEALSPSVDVRIDFSKRRGVA